MEARREEEHPIFETSHVLGAHLVSSPLLPLSWSQCAAAANTETGFVVQQVGDVFYVAFSGVQSVASMLGAPGSGGDFFAVVPIGTGEHGLFSDLSRGQEDGGEPVMVHARSLQLFLAMQSTSEFQVLATGIKNKAVIFTGHSIGGTLASLATLYFLCSSTSTASLSPASLLCITFGSPLLGNSSLSQAILRERWADKFCHVVAQHDIVPRLLFCPSNSISRQLIAHLLQSLQFAMRYPNNSKPASQFTSEEKANFHLFISMHISRAAADLKLSDSVQQESPYRPFGNYVLCSGKGAVCIDNLAAVIRMLYLTFATGSAVLSIEDEHLSYGNLIDKISMRLLQKTKTAIDLEVPRTSHSAGIQLALQASGIGIQDMLAVEAQECLKMSKRIESSPSLKCANLAIKLAKVTPCRAQIEWYKASCDEDTGYYDAFKYRKASKRDSKVNLNRIKLGQFWDNVVDMIQSSELPHDFHKRNKWVNAAHFYRLLVEPLDVAEYYKTQKHKTKGHYVSHGRERRYEVFNRWWDEKKKESHEKGGSWKRSKFAGLTQDSCFWARVEESIEWMEEVRKERGPKKLEELWKNLNGFDLYAKQLVERKEVSIDVLAPKSSYSLWAQEWNEFKLELCLQISPLSK